MFDQADKELNAAYQQALSGITDSKQKESFVESQKAWVKYRDANVTFFAARYPYSKGGLFFNLDLTKKRTAYLKSVHATSPAKTPEGPSDQQDGLTRFVTAIPAGSAISHPPRIAVMPPHAHRLHPNPGCGDRGGLMALRMSYAARMKI